MHVCVLVVLVVDLYRIVVDTVLVDVVATCSITCTSYCLHSSCSFSCGGDSTIENTLNCVGLCTSSSCSATGQEWI